MNKEVLKEQIKRHEGEVLEVYEDSLGYLTLGVGHLIREDDQEFGEPSGTPVSQEVVDRYYEVDFDKHVDETLHVCDDHGIDFDTLPENIQHVKMDREEEKSDMIMDKNIPYLDLDNDLLNQSLLPKNNQPYIDECLI